MTLSRSQGHGVPRLPLGASTPSRMPTPGRMEKVALEVTARRMRTGSMPRARPARHARTMKMTQTTAMTAIITPQIRNIEPLFSCWRTELSIPVASVFLMYEL